MTMDDEKFARDCNEANFGCLAGEKAATPPEFMRADEDILYVAQDRFEEMIRDKDPFASQVFASTPRTTDNEFERRWNAMINRALGEPHEAESGALTRAVVMDAIATMRLGRPVGNTAGLAHADFR